MTQYNSDSANILHFLGLWSRTAWLVLAACRFRGQKKRAHSPMSIGNTEWHFFTGGKKKVCLITTHRKTQGKIHLLAISYVPGVSLLRHSPQLCGGQ